MERKNTVLLTVIAVATLLVAVVGATFAYFTATATGEGAGTTSTSTTATVKGATLTLAPQANAQKLEYPGGVAYTGVKVTAAAASGDTNKYTLSYALKLSYTNETTTALNYTVYKTTSALTNNLSTCALQQPTVNGTTQLYYSNCPTAADLGGATSIATGTLAANTTTATNIDIKNGSADLTADTDDAVGAFYYVVVEYPNNADVEGGASGNQNADMGKKITFQITGTTTPIQTQKTA